MVTHLNKLKFQKTIKKEVAINGIGLHTGCSSKIFLCPASSNHGIKFQRIDLEGHPTIDALIDNVIDVTRGTSIGFKKVEVHTVEHLLAALNGLEIDNLLIKIDNVELPILDGSSKPYVDLLLESGLEEQDTHRLELIIDETITYSNSTDGVDIHIVPSDKFRITFMMDYKHPSLGTQYTSFYSIIEEFINNVAPARTFCLLSEVVNLLDCNLIKGGSLDNSLVFKDIDLSKDDIKKIMQRVNIELDSFRSSNQLLNKTELRYYNEPVRHKLLDLLGDLCLLGVPIKGHVIAARSGHSANIELVKNIKKRYFKKGSIEECHKRNRKFHLI